MRTPLLLAASALLGCGSPSLGDLDTGTVAITVSGIATQPAVVSLGEPQGGMGVASAFVSMSSLTLLPCRADAAEVTLSARGYELLNDPPLQELVNTAVTELCGLRFDIDPLEQNATEGVPEGASLYVTGTNALGAEFEIASEQSFSLSFEVDSNDSFGAEPLILGFDVSTWLAAVPMDVGYEHLTVEAVENQLRSSVALYRDGDGNGVLEGDEQTPVATAATAR
jgi:hypothetical protein